ncbi:hypothetical protein D1T48_gp16 [Thermoproteus tenax virus 1]|uniref:Uncharacterized 7.1 kDa protein n=1 Tax=Thermoproteus tenax virus 1 (strain KRA1) TaxID=10480 RepID=YORG_TTV1K|nr:hypothetical protein D1T48_gp16 [Thermoproteus tenax virus 1]P19291.1 RecName: Full=Uncharacterized 7.1 kDa protein [Thermoproteus tenax virus 1 (STRAIN KRA1)]CAA32985.1 unnamed protein product [Thermoproteus tenax virus 1]
MLSNPSRHISRQSATDKRRLKSIKVYLGHAEVVVFNVSRRGQRISNRLSLNIAQFGQSLYLVG